MILIYCLIFIVFEAVTEGLLKRFGKADFIFNLWLQWVIALFLFGVWFIIAYHTNVNYVPVWKLITGFVFVRFAVFDLLWNLARGVKWNYYGTTKLYDRIMTELGGWGWMMKIVCGIVGICFLIGWS